MRYRTLAVSVATAGIALGAAACSSSSSSSSAAAAAPATSASSSAAAPASSASSSAAAPSSSATGSSTSMTDFGSGCAAVPASGAGSFTGMATAPVATAASANPVLSTLVTAVKAAGLVDTLNSAKSITVFAPANSAFAKIAPATLKTVLGDKALLTKILTYHVVAGRVTPAELASGAKLKTLEGGTVKPAKMGSTYEVNGAQVVCGNVQTANATVYIISSVLMPK